MPDIQISESEIALLNKILIFIRKREIHSFSIHLLFIIYSNISTYKIPLFQYSHLKIASLIVKRTIQHNLLYCPKQS